MTSNEGLLVLFGINGKKRLIPIWYQNQKKLRLTSKKLGRDDNQPPSVDVLQKMAQVDIDEG